MFYLSPYVCKSGHIHRAWLLVGHPSVLIIIMLNLYSSLRTEINLDLIELNDNAMQAYNHLNHQARRLSMEDALKGCIQSELFKIEEGALRV